MFYACFTCSTISEFKNLPKYAAFGKMEPLQASKAGNNTACKSVLLPLGLEPPHVKTARALITKRVVS